MEDLTTDDPTNGFPVSRMLVRLQPQRLATLTTDQAAREASRRFSVTTRAQLRPA